MQALDRGGNSSAEDDDEQRGVEGANAKKRRVQRAFDVCRRKKGQSGVFILFRSYFDWGICAHAPGPGLQYDVMGQPDKGIAVVIASPLTLTARQYLRKDTFFILFMPQQICRSCKEARAP